ncbi:MAG: hypothetical protein E7551_08245 [Ruminococcaceae bacterium]|nr:hypothetical protein [Oscillospiraceae bacterium]
MKKTNKKDDFFTPSSNSVHGQPKNAFELINKYGTYNIQPTNDSDNEFPKIAQGLPKNNLKKPR